MIVLPFLASAIAVALASALYAVKNRRNQNLVLGDQKHAPEYRCQKQLKWSLRGVDNDNNTIPTPFVTVNDILPEALLNAALSEIEKRITIDEDGELDCWLHQMYCGNERWIDLTLSDVQSSSFEPRDVIEQAVYEISKYDMLNIIPASVAPYVKGVSWRILKGKSGRNLQNFHYDSDEETDNILDDQGLPPSIFALASTVTYLTDNGEPTVIFEQTQLEQVGLEELDSNFQNKLEYLLENNITKYEDPEVHPCNVYVSMPKAGKHIAFDSRLFHGSMDGVPKNPGKRRIAFGINFHTHRSMETILEDTNSDGFEQSITRPLDLSSLSGDGPEMIPWSPPRDTKALRDQNPKNVWEPITVHTYYYGYEYCRNLAPCYLKLNLPKEQILADEEDDDKSGATLGYALNSGDLFVGPIRTEKAFSIMQNVTNIHQATWDENGADATRQAKEVAMAMLEQRCEIYDHDLLTMSPPQNYYYCEKRKVEASSSIE